MTILTTTAAVLHGAHASVITGLTNGPGPTKNAPSIDWVPSADVQRYASQAAFFLMVIWIGWIAMQFILPSRRGRSQVGWGKFVVTGVFCVLLLDLTTVKTIANGLLNIFWAAFGLFGIV